MSAVSRLIASREAPAEEAGPPVLEGEGGGDAGEDTADRERGLHPSNAIRAAVRCWSVLEEDAIGEPFDYCEHVSAPSGRDGFTWR